MNERIQELAMRANSHHGNSFDLNYKELDVFLSKFAELIVRECIDTVSDCSVEYCTRPQIVSEIKQHFGVEE